MANSNIVTIYNRSKQLIALQVRPPKGDFFLHEQQVRLAKSKGVKLPSDYVNWDQVKNLRSRGLIQVSGKIP